MGFFDKLKGAMNAVTGGAAKVTLEFDPPQAQPGDTIRVKISATSSGGEVKSKGVYVDLWGSENVRIPKGSGNNVGQEVTATENTFTQEFQIAPAFVLAAKETKLWEGQLQIPASVQPSYMGKLATHQWKIQGRIEAAGNDPDSGWKDLRIGR